LPDLKITQLTALPEAANDNLLVIVNDPTGSPITQKITLSNLKKDILNTTPKTSNYTVTANDGVLWGNATSGSFTFSLPTATSTIKGLELTFVKTDSSTNTITIDPDGAQTINDAPTYILYGQYQTLTIYCDGSNWKIKSIAGSINSELYNINYTPTGTEAAGSLYWDSTEGTLASVLTGGNVKAYLGTQLYARVRNVEATTLTAGEVVYLYGSTGNRATVKRAFNTGDPTSSKTLGIVAESIAANQIGYVITQGVIDKMSLGSPYVEGDILWLGSTPGTFTRVKPTQPDHLVFIGIVERANAGNGQIYVKPQNGYEINELHDVLITSPQDGQGLVYENATTLWKNKNVLGDSYETISKNLKAYPATLAYGGTGDLNTITYTVPSGTITKTFNYTAGNLTSIVLSGSTPSGINLTKTLTYTTGNLTGVSYS
jgi:hypothetical protein